MATGNAVIDPNFDFNDVLSRMQDDNKAKRRKALEKFNEMVFEKDTESEQDNLTETLLVSLPSLVSRLSDQSEVNRINVCNILLKFIEANTFTEKQLIDVIPVVHHRIGHIPRLEESEDVRHLYINIIHGLTKCFQARMIPYMNDVINILKESVLDASPEARKAACECVSTFAKVTKEKFHMQSESLVKPLIKGLSHQRFKNRIACINALGDIVLYGDGKVIKDVGGPLAQCSMDLPQVRLVVVTVGGTFALEMLDRYSYWHHILPLFLFGLNDEDIDVKNKAETLWLEVGHQYETENEDQLKKEIDFDVNSSSFPVGEKRPCVGCRTLVCQSLYHILPGLLADLDDWQAGPRLQSAKLLTTLVLNAETGITQYAEKIMIALHLAATDKEENVVRQVILCSEYLGHFLPPTTYLPLVLPRLCAGENGECPLKILAALIRGSPDSLVANEMTTIVQTISSEDVAHVYHPDHQSALLELISIIIQKCDVQENSYDLFCTLLFIASSSEIPDMVSNVEEQFSALACKSEHDSLDGLYRQHLNAILKYLLQSAESWLEHTPQFQMFLGVLEFAGQALGSELELIVSILCTSVPKKQDPLVSLRCFTKMQQLLMRSDCPLQSDGQHGKCLPKFVSECVAILLPWHAGMTASSLRTAALACLVAVCQVKGIQEELVKEVKFCLDLIPALIEDEAEDTRRFSCDAIYWIENNYQQLIDSDTLHRLADKLVKRLDDVKAGVRLKAAHILSFLFEQLPENYDASMQSARLQELFETIVIYLDDPDIKLQEAVMHTLDKMGRISPNLLTELLERDCHKYRNKHYCVKLIEDMKTLSITA